MQARQKLPCPVLAASLCRKGGKVAQQRSVRYGLDPVGNRTSATSTISGLAPIGGTFNQDDELASEGYDQNGNVTASGGKTFSYDSQNQLVSMNGGAVQIIYDGDGNRVAKTVLTNGVPATTYYLVDDLNPTGYPQVVEELQGTTVTRQYTYGLQRIDENQFISNQWVPSFYGYDGGGSVRQLTSAAGTMTDSYEYDAYGNSFTVSGSTPNEMMYRGEQYDSDLGLYYLRARYYNPLTGRFMSKDPLDPQLFDSNRRPIDPRELHKYLYAGSDPVNWIDPSGRDVLLSYAFKDLKSVAGGIIFLNTVSCAVNIGIAASTSDFISALYGRSGAVAGALGWGGLASTTYGCITVAWRATGYLATLNNNVGVLGCGIGVAQSIYDLNEYAKDPTEDNSTTFVKDWAGGLLGCSATLVALSL